MQNYRADPPVCAECRGAQKVEPREGTAVRKERLGGVGRRGATRGSGSISTHLNFGPSQGQYGRTTRPRPPLSVTSSGFFFSCSRIQFSPSLFFSPARSPSAPPLLPRRCSYRIIASYRARTHALSSVPPYKCFFLFFFFFSRTILRSREIPIRGDTRVIGPANSIAGYRRTRDNSHDED